MRTSASTSPARIWARLPLGLLGMLALIAAIEPLIALRATSWTRFYIYDWRVTSRAATRAASDADVLFLGDSLVKFSLAPLEFERRTGLRAYNLALCGGQATSSYYLLRRALAAGARPRAVVVDFAPYLLAEGPRHNAREWPEMIALGEFLDLAWKTRHAAFCGRLALAALVPSIKDRDEIRAAVLEAATGARAQTLDRADELAAIARNWVVNRGALLCPRRESYDGSINATSKTYFPARFAPDPVEEADARRLLDLASRHHVRVFWLLTPTTPRFQERLDALGLTRGHDDWLRRIQRDWPSLTVIDARRGGFAHDDFIDPLHLNVDGARALTDAVADLVPQADGDVAPTRGWLAARRPSGDAGPSRLEDFERTRLGLHEATERRAR